MRNVITLHPKNLFLHRIKLGYSTTCVNVSLQVYYVLKNVFVIEFDINLMTLEILKKMRFNLIFRFLKSEFYYT